MTTTPETLAARLLAYADGNSLVIPTAARLLLLEAVAALTAPDRVGWQPIASAPRDGTRLLLWLDTRNPRDTPYVEQVCDGDHVVQADIGFWDEDPGCWRAPIIGEPTHWRPLPEAPPAIEAGEHGGDHAE